MELPSRGGSANRFQASGQAWDPGRADIVQLLEEANHEHTAPIYYGSNHCFLVTLSHARAGQSLAVYKPGYGEYPLYDFPNGTLYRREVGSWLVDWLLGWSLVPPTVVTEGKHGTGSLQLFIEGYSEGQIQIKELQRMALLDTVLNNADRKSEHCLIGNNGKLWGIDHGLTFNVHGKLRTVLWHFAGTPIPPQECEDLEHLRGVLLAAGEPAADQLQSLVSGQEWKALSDRVERVLKLGRFPNPRYKAVPYRW
jgi:hypothetical protein